MNQKFLSQDQIEATLRIAANPSGDPASLRERERGVLFLLAHAEDTFPYLMKLLQEKPLAWEAPRLVEILGRYNREQSVPLLKDLLLQNIADTSRAAGRALGTITSTSAADALLEGIKALENEVRIAAIEGMRIRGDQTWCSALEAALSEPEANVRYYAVNAAAELGCLDKQRLRQIAESDPDPDVQHLAREWLKK